MNIQFFSHFLRTFAVSKKHGEQLQVSANTIFLVFLRQIFVHLTLVRNEKKLFITSQTGGGPRRETLLQEFRRKVRRSYHEPRGMVQKR